MLRNFFFLSVYILNTALFSTEFLSEKNQRTLSSLAFYLDQTYQLSVGQISHESNISFSEYEALALWQNIVEAAILSSDTYHTKAVLEAQTFYLNWLSKKEDSTDLFQSFLKIQDLREKFLALDLKQFDEPLFTNDSVFQEVCSQTNFANNSILSKKNRKKLKPFLLPNQHPIKCELDKLFSKTRVIENPESILKAGFHIVAHQSRSFIYVLKHPHLPKYLVKAVLDSEKRKKRNKPEWIWFLRRCRCAKKIAKLISSQKIKHFIAPQKWIFLLPSNPPPSKSDYLPKPVVLVVKKFELAPHAENLNAWKNIKKAQLKELYKLVSLLPRISIRPDNLPLTITGEFAFIDTEYVSGPPAYDFIRPYLSAEMCKYWDHLVKKGS